MGEHEAALGSDPHPNIDELWDNAHPFADAMQDYATKYVGAAILTVGRDVCAQLDRLNRNLEAITESVDGAERGGSLLRIGGFVA